MAIVSEHGDSREGDANRELTASDNVDLLDGDIGKRGDKESEAGRLDVGLHLDESGIDPVLKQSGGGAALARVA